MKTYSYLCNVIINKTNLMKTLSNLFGQLFNVISLALYGNERASVSETKW